MAEDWRLRLCCAQNCPGLFLAAPLQRRLEKSYSTAITDELSGYCRTNPLRRASKRKVCSARNPPSGLVKLLCDQHNRLRLDAPSCARFGEGFPLVVTPSCSAA